MKLDEFIEAARKDDFQVGDSFWMGDFKFEVVDMSDAIRLVKDPYGVVGKIVKAVG